MVDVRGIWLEQTVLPLLSYVTMQLSESFAYCSGVCARFREVEREGGRERERGGEGEKDREKGIDISALRAFRQCNTS